MLRTLVGAGAGAVAGGLAGGGEGAAKGTAVGAGAGFGSTLIERGDEVELKPGTELRFKTSTPSMVLLTRK